MWMYGSMLEWMKIIKEKFWQSEQVKMEFHPLNWKFQKSLKWKDTQFKFNILYESQVYRKVVVVPREQRKRIHHGRLSDTCGTPLFDPRTIISVIHLQQWRNMARRPFILWNKPASELSRNPNDLALNLFQCVLDFYLLRFDSLKFLGFFPKVTSTSPFHPRQTQTQTPPMRQSSRFGQIRDIMTDKQQKRSVSLRYFFHFFHFFLIATHDVFYF